MSDNRTDLPSVNAPNFSQRLRETIQTYLGKQGNPLDRGLTLRDLIETGVLKIREGFQLKPGTGGSVPLEPGDGVVDVYEPDLTPPPTPATLTATPAISHVIIQHEVPLYTQGHGHLRTRLYGKIVNAGDPLPTFADAVEVAQFDGTVYAFPSNPATTWRFWIKWETVDGVLSTTPAGGTNGVTATTGQDVSRLVLAMTGPGNPFKVVTEQVTLPDGSVVPAGTYTADAFIHNGQISNAMIANLTVDNAKIASVAVDKLTAGSLSVGQYIQSTSYVAGTSGWKINADGTAELANATVRGAMYANSGTIGGVTISSNNIRVGQTAFDTGSGFYIGSDGKLSIGNSSGNKLTWDNTDLKITGNITASAGTIGGSDIGSGYIRSTNYSANTSGWQIKSDGSAEFNGVVLSRNQIVAFGTLNLGLVNFTDIGGGRYEAGPFLVNTGITIAAWSSGTSPYVALGAANSSGLWYGQVGTAEGDRYWGVKTEVLPWTNWQGASYMWLSLMIYTQFMIKADPCKIDWKIYKVT